MVERYAAWLKQTLLSELAGVEMVILQRHGALPAQGDGRAWQAGLRRFLEDMEAGRLAARSDEAAAYWPRGVEATGWRLLGLVSARQQAMLSFLRSYTQESAVAIAVAQALASSSAALQQVALQASPAAAPAPWSDAAQPLVLHALGAGVLGVDREGLIAYANPEAAAVLGMPGSAMLGRPLREVLQATGAGPLDPVEGVLATLQDLGTRRLLCRLQRAEDGALPVEILASPAADDAGLRGAVVVLNDLTERRAGERRLVSLIGHDLRSPMTALAGAMRVLKSTVEAEVAPEGRAARMVAIAAKSVDQLIALSNHILDAERLQSGLPALAPQACDLGALVSEAHAALGGQGAASGVELLADVPAATVWADPARVVHALVTLLGLLAAASHAGARVHVSAAPSQGGWSVSLRTDGLDRLPDGLGDLLAASAEAAAYDALRHHPDQIGLVACADAIARMGGRLSLADAGFCFTLPAPACEGLLLVAEEDAAIRAVLELLLSSRGYRMRAVAAEAIAAEARATAPAAVLVEARRAGPVIEALQADGATRRMPVLQLANAGERPEPLPEGLPGGVLTKPFKKADLVAALRAVLPVSPVEGATA